MGLNAFRLSRREFVGSAAALSLSPLPVRAGEPAPEPLLDGLFREGLDADPTTASLWGYRRRDGTPQNRWTIRNHAWFAEQEGRLRRHLARLDQGVGLNPLDVELFRHVAADQLDRIRWRENDYIFYSFSAPWLVGLSHLIEYQPVDNEAGAAAYLDRLRHLRPWIEADLDTLEARSRSGTHLPAFNFPDLIATARASAHSIQTDAAAHPVAKDFAAKMERAGLPQPVRERLSSQLRRVLEAEIAPAVIDAVPRLETLAAASQGDNGVWALRDGGDYYRSLIRSHTSVDGDPDEIHAYGLAEVARLQSELVGLGPRLSHAGSARDLLQYLATNARFFLPSTPAGRQRYFAMAQQHLATINKQMPRLIEAAGLPGVEIREVDPVSAPSSGRAFYVEPRADGSPGVFFVNTHNMAANPTYQLEAVVYHEAVPGHHLQAAMAQAGPALPLFRKHLYLNSFAEGWALYAEKLPKELGLYRTAEADAGRIALELFRAVRLVVDTGIHHKRWSFDQALAYMNANTGNARPDNLLEVKRYFNWPAQALGYKIGMRKIEELRALANARLGTRFNLPRFHAALLRNGALTLPLLERAAERFIAEGGA